MENSNQTGKFDGVTALDANEVKALFWALRNEQGGLARLLRTFESLKDRLTPSGQAAYQRELSKLLQSPSAVPQELGELLDGEYGLVIRGEVEMIGTVRCYQGKLWVVLPGEPEELVLKVGFEGVLTSESPKAYGTLRTRDGYLFLELEIMTESPGGPRKVQLSGIGDVRAGRA
ncbi:MAG: hypothetical protein HY901_09320 [Deltaproteobacteria bacterium]|nr:hypothetical protein [Deltaproteobacteria bacterium]